MILLSKYQDCCDQTQCHCNIPPCLVGCSIGSLEVVVLPEHEMFQEILVPGTRTLQCGRNRTSVIPWLISRTVHVMQQSSASRSTGAGDPHHLGYVTHPNNITKTQCNSNANMPITSL